MKVAQVKKEIIWDWMRPEVASIQKEASLEDAISRMKKLNVHHLVIQDGKTLVGILDARDCAGIWNKSTPVTQLMRSDFPKIDENTDIRKVVELFVTTHFTGLPLLLNGKVHGIITITDLLKLLDIHLTQGHPFAKYLEKGIDFLANPLLQSLSRLMENAGL